MAGTLAVEETFTGLTGGFASAAQLSVAVMDPDAVELFGGTSLAPESIAPNTSVDAFAAPEMAQAR